MDVVQPFAITHPGKDADGVKIAGDCFRLPRTFHEKGDQEPEQAKDASGMPDEYVDKAGQCFEGKQTGTIYDPRRDVEKRRHIFPDSRKHHDGKALLS